MKKGWEYKKLGEIGTFVRGGNFSKKDFVEDGFPCIHYGQIHMKFGIETLKHISSVPAEMVKADRCAKKGDLVIAITSEDNAGSCKCTAWMGDYDVYVGGHTAIYRHTMQPKYVSYYFMSPYFQKDKLEYTHGFKVVEISPKDIAKISIPVPSLYEQQRIVDYLDAAFAKIDAMKANAEKSLNEAKALFQASLKEMLEPKEGWEEKTIQEICSSIVDCPHTTPRKVSFPTKYPCIRTSELKGGCIDWSSMQYLDENEYKKRVSRLIPKANDLVYGREGTYGDAVLLPEGYNFSLGQRTMLLRPNEIYIIPRFFLYSMISSYVYKQAKAKNSGCGVGHVNVKDIKLFKINLPTIDIQQRIVATLDSLKSKVDRLQANFEKISQECDALKQAILRQIFE